MICHHDGDRKGCYVKTLMEARGKNMCCVEFLYMCGACLK